MNTKLRRPSRADGGCAIRWRRGAWCLRLAGVLVLEAATFGAESSGVAPLGQSVLDTGGFRWRTGPPLQAPVERPEDHCYSVKDPTVVRHDGRWHLFTTIRSEKRTHQIEYTSFADWSEASTAKRSILQIHPGYFCAPQVFWFSPHRRWYLIHQASDPSRPVELQPAFATTETLGNPVTWSPPRFLFDKHPASVKGWIDFWVICDDTKAHLFFTSNNGMMWRAETRLEQFPSGWSEPTLVLKDDIFEASHTYRLGKDGGYLTLIEAEARSRRYYKAYRADRLDGVWKPLAGTLEKPFASSGNVRFTAGARWAESISHGELLRIGVDEHLEIDPDPLKWRFLFQGALDQDMAGRPYGQIPWRLGVLEWDAETSGDPGAVASPAKAAATK